MAKRFNKVVTINRHGGLVGVFSSRASSLASHIDSYNREGWNVVQVLEAERGNLFITMLSFMVLCFTMFLWTFLPSYLVILEQEE